MSATKRITAMGVRYSAKDVEALVEAAKRARDALAALMRAVVELSAPDTVDCIMDMVDPEFNGVGVELQEAIKRCEGKP